MRRSRTSVAGLAVAVLLFAACSSSTPSLPPLVTLAPTIGPSAAVAAPEAPTDFTATRKSGSVPCPSSEDSCSQTDFAWQAGADPGTGFKIYSAATGEDPAATCKTVQTQAESALDVESSARTAQVFDPMGTGGGQICYWITAVNSTGESAQVPAAGN